MAKTRMINTSFWRDNFITNLDPSERYLYLYLLTNPDTNISGVYQIPLKIMATDTGYDAEMLLKMLSKFEEYGKIKYENGWVAIKNFIKNQNQKSITVKKGIENELKNAPEGLILWLKTNLEGIDTLSHLNLNLNLNLNSNLNLNPDEVDSDKNRINLLKSAIKEKYLLANKRYTENKNTNSYLEAIFKTGLSDEEILKRLDNFFRHGYFFNKDSHFLNSFLANIELCKTPPATPKKKLTDFEIMCMEAER